MQLIRLVVILAVNFPLGTLGAPASAPVAGAVAEQNLDTRGIAGSDAAWTTMTTGVNTAMNDLKTIGEKAQGDLAGNRALLAHALNVMNAISNFVDNLDDRDLLIGLLSKLAEPSGP